MLSGLGAALILHLLPPGRDWVWLASMTTAYLALAAMAATLVVAPLRLMAGRKTPVSFDLRRDLGIWTGILGLAHVLVGFNVHLRGRPWLYLVYAQREHHRFPIRHDLFGFANESGLIGAILFILLLATSNDRSLTRLKAGKWKRLQQWTYGLLALTALHGWLFQHIETRKPGWVAAFLGMLGLAVVLQIAGVFARRGALRSAAR